jgi:proteasome lid subunit RPN8/RPN11
LASDPLREVCGLLGGYWAVYPRFAFVTSWHPIPNVDPQPETRYRLEPGAQLAVMLKVEVVAIYHSHPAGPLWPSPADIAEWAYPDALCIIGLPGGEIGAWRIVGGEVVGVEILMGEGF